MLELCEVCSHPRPDRHKTKCTVGLEQLFDTISERSPMLDITPTKLGLGEGGAHEFESKPPINLTARAHQDPASVPYPLGPDDVRKPTLSVSGTLYYWETVAAKAGGHYRDLGWVVHQPWIGDMVADLRTLAAQLMAATGDPRPKPVGHCRRVIGLGDRELLVCGEPLYLPADPDNPRGDDEPITDLPSIVCPEPSCGTRYTGVELLRLKLAEDPPPRPPSPLTSAREGTPQRLGDPDPAWRWLTCDAYEAAQAAGKETA